MARDYEQRVSEDRFGNPYILVNCKDNKKNSEFNVGYGKIGGKLHKFEVSRNNKDGGQYWVRVTKMDEKKQAARKNF